VRHVRDVLGLMVLVAPFCVIMFWPVAAISSDAVLQEPSLGAEDAPVTMIEYSSLTCPHCADFHTEILPQIKEQYIAPGKLRLVYRDYPLDPLATAAAMLPHCVGPDRYFGLLEALFRSQSVWARSQEPAKELERLARFAGLSSAEFQACLNNSALLEAIQQRAEAARREHNVTSTPTFIINGQRIVGASGFEEFERVIEQQLGGADEPAPASAPATETPPEAAGGGAESGWLARQWDRLRAWWNS
jgi:protein-disulfide isomerase